MILADGMNCGSGVFVQTQSGGGMDTNKLLKVLVVTNVLTLVLAVTAIYLAMEARDYADDAYSEAESASSRVGAVEDILNSRR
jgi:hypothetical protein